MPRRAAAPKNYATEADLCAAFLDQVRTWNEEYAFRHERDRWTAYAETEGWDILLSRDVDGFQIGFQAKLRFTAAALAQCLDEHHFQVGSPGPDCRAVLVPAGSAVAGIVSLADHCGVTVVTVEPRAGKYHHRDVGGHLVRPRPPKLGDWHSEDRWHEWTPMRRCELPEYVPDVRAGVPAPVQLTSWKIKAIKLCIILELRGFVTRDDFRHLSLDHRRWLSPGQEWLRLDGRHLVAGTYFPRLRRLHPQVYEQIKADAARWLPKGVGAPDGQGALL